MDFEAECLVRPPRAAKCVLTLRLDGKLNELRLRTGGQVRDLHLLIVGQNILQHVQQDAIGQVGWKIYVASFNLFLVFLLIAHGDLARGRSNRYIDRLRKHRPSLDMMIADETKMTTLSKDGCFVIDRAVFETIDQTGFQLFSADRLN